MCGLVAIFAYGSHAADVDAAELMASRDAMAARGPDAAGLWLDEGRKIGLGHRRLSIVDLSAAANQPLTTGDGRYRIVFNGEIYNYRQLRERLQKEGVRLATASDTEVVLHLYAQQGAACVSDLRGMFAFVIWDAVERRLFAARDPYGIKPLYVADDGQTLRLASQVKALSASGHVSKRLDGAAAQAFFCFGHIPEPWTVFSAIRALPAGTTLTAENGRVGLPMPYAPLAAAFRPQATTHADLVAATAQAIDDSVAAHRIADVPVGVFLSAGVDSTLLAWALTQQQADRKPLAITLSFSEFAGSAQDETPQAIATAHALGLEHHVHELTRDRFVAELPQFFAAMDQPTIDGVNTYFVAAAARAAGLKAVISGIGGDELFGGYPSFRDIPRWRQAARWLMPFRPLAPLWRHGIQGLRRMPTLAKSLPAKLANILDVPANMAGMYLLRRAVFMPREAQRLAERFGPGAFDPLAYIADALPAEFGGSGDSSDYAAIALLESTLYLRHQLLRDADWAGMAHSLEIRTPLVDHALLQTLAPLLAGCPSRVDKSLLCTEANGNMLAPLLARPKSGFATPVDRWLAEAGLIAGPKHPGAAARDWAEYVYARYVEAA